MQTHTETVTTGEIRAGTEMYSSWWPRGSLPRRECTEGMVHEEEAEASDGWEGG